MRRSTHSCGALPLALANLLLLLATAAAAPASDCRQYLSFNNANETSAKYVWCAWHEKYNRRGSSIEQPTFRYHCHRWL